MILRTLGYLFGAVAFLFLAGSAGVAWYVSDLASELPDYEVLADYAPPMTTKIHAADGQLIAEYARERRLYLPITAIPARVTSAFLSAEDKNFHDHFGLDVLGIARAVVQNIQAYHSGDRLVGASTITQQVAKNFLLTNERSIDRKIKEAILALRIEDAFSKQDILELYLNDIFLGLRTYGVAAAALTYFGKTVDELTLAEAAYLAALPKGPNNYHPFRHTQAAIERRNWVIDRMVDNGYVTAAVGEAAKQERLGVRRRFRARAFPVADYFSDAVRLQVIDMFGEDMLYEGGLSVRTSLNPVLQAHARKSLINGLVGYDREQGWRGPVANIDLDDDWGVALAKISPITDIPEWRLAVVLSVSETESEIGMRPNRIRGTNRVRAERLTGIIRFEDMSWAHKAADERRGKALTSPEDVLAIGDVVYVEATADKFGLYRLRQVPDVGGGLVAMDPHTGRVLAMVGGFSFEKSQFNRATQAARQPGSAFKPFVYAAALDSGYTPSSVVKDAPIAIDPGFGQPIWRPQNYSNKYYGPSTLRTGIERSRNVMTVRLAQDLGMPVVAEYARRFGVYDTLAPFLPMSLGSGETTVLRMVRGYSVLANGGLAVSPTLIDRIQNRYGDTIFRDTERVCEGCAAEAWVGQDEPTIIDRSERVLDPMTAYQITSMLEGVVQRGTATIVSKSIDRPIAGKTGTTNDYRDAWFVGYAPNLVVGVYVGYDQPRNLGRSSTGGRLAAPIFVEFMQAALAGSPPVGFRVPPGMTFIPINPKTGLRAQSDDPSAILEAFKPGTVPPERYSIIGSADAVREPSRSVPGRVRQSIRGSGLY